MGIKPLRAVGLLAGVVFLWGVAAPASGQAAQGTPKDAAPILVDFPEPGSIFPPDIAPPTFLWRETTGGAIAWRVEVLFGERGHRVKQKSPGEKPQVGEIDTTLVGYVPPTLTAEQDAQHTWKPDPELWEKIKKQSQKHQATLVITGFRDERLKQPVSSGSVELRDFHRSGGRSHLLSRRAVDPARSLGARARHHPPAVGFGASEDQVAAPLCKRDEQQDGDGEPAHLRQLPFHLAGWKDPRHRRGRAAER